MKSKALKPAGVVCFRTDRFLEVNRNTAHENTKKRITEEIPKPCHNVPEME